jgi:Fe2+ or Zn2+ uptake regulation protein
MGSYPTDSVLVEKLRERGQRVTSQRVVIHRLMSERDQHLTAEQVHDAVADRLPGTSLPTVYATLELFEELGLVRRVSTGSGAVLFDSRVTPHAHAVCRTCGALADVDTTAVATDALRRARAGGFRPDHAQLVIWGTCASCAASSE